MPRHLPPRNANMRRGDGSHWATLKDILEAWTD